MARKKTAKIEDILVLANGMLLNSAPDRGDFRQGVRAMVEKILMDADVYTGFRYLNEEEMDKSIAGGLPGIRLSEDYLALEQYFKDTDDTRVHYF
jgi:hypothetical protein